MVGVTARIIGMEAAFWPSMRCIKLTGREATVIRAIGFTETMLGAEIQDFTRMELEDVTDALNGLMAAGFVESIPYFEEVQLAEMPVTAFEINPAYVHEIRQAIQR
jgi:2-polyprenyl-6-methoxyphenol hydroxylase-like FAD-dependent oxidoreductase